MVVHKRVNKRVDKRQQETQPIRQYVSELVERYGQYSRPAEEVRRIVDESMGGATLSGLISRMRSEA